MLGKGQLPLTGFQACCRKKQQLDLDQAKQPLGTEIETEGMQPGVHLAHREDPVH